MKYNRTNEDSIELQVPSRRETIDLMLVELLKAERGLKTRHNRIMKRVDCFLYSSVFLAWLYFLISLFY